MEFRWNEGNQEHVSRHGVTPEEAEDVIRGARSPFPLVHKDEKYLVWGPGTGGRLLQVVFVIGSDDAVFVIPCAASNRSGEETLPTEVQMKKRAKPRAKPSYEKMKAHELAEATEHYGQEMIVDKFKPMGAAARRLWDRARRKPGRPRRGKGAKVISVSVERELLSRSDALARNLGVSRASLIERGLKAVLVVEGKL